MEYNDISNEKSDFTLDIHIKKVFYGKRSLNPSIFFGVDNAHKHFSLFFLKLYLVATRLIIKREFNIYLDIFIGDSYFDIVNWRKLYYDHNLSDGRKIVSQRVAPDIHCMARIIRHGNTPRNIFSWP